MKNRFLLALSLTVFANQLWAHELILPRSLLLKQGYRPTEILPLGEPPVLKIKPGSLSWPVKFEDDAHTMGNTMAQFQSYGGGPAYYHGGCDLRVSEGAWVTAPIAGKIEAGPYAYDYNGDGSLRKFFKPWPETGDALYFEVAIVTADNYRFEFHHIDRDSLPDPIVKLLNAGGGLIEKGTPLGRVVSWPIAGPDGTIYHHTHYNIVDPSGLRWNPEYLSTTLEDSTPPVIHAVFAVLASGGNKEIKSGESLGDEVTEFVVATTDTQAPDVYVHPPEVAELKFETGPVTRWDFRQKLATADGSFPPIWDFFLAEIATPEGNTLSTEGNYSNNFFLIRLKVPAKAKGPFQITLGDQRNAVSFPGTLQ